ncbi:hypothetical protein CYMTET_51645 [Cymbomonas tetramitiformis]|uniref:MOSC domain-containing protein n=1 Tax=Cymbomonas tetramitiformis TaxID=36881 RepID=A0AAE0BKL4_9CHLO|nr:hypothetical protein CYMTET_51645 [Cymbomonas tetramitiformis]
MASCIIEGIYAASKSTGDMRLLQSAKLVAGLGMAGDRYAEHCGTYTIVKEPGRQLTLISADAVEAATAAHPEPLEPVRIGNLRRNVVLRGVTCHELNSCVGRKVQIGACVLFVHRLCVPCMYNEMKNGCEGLRDALWYATGVNCEVLAGGDIHVGDRVNLGLEWDPDLSRVNDGGKPQGFYVHPKKRSAQEAKANKGMPAEVGQKLALKDPEGEILCLREPWRPLFF